MRILVTGGAGFIGSHLCEQLLRRGHAVAVLDDLNDFYDPREKRKNLEEIGRVSAFRFCEGDICDEEAVSKAVDGFGPEAIIHLAARAGVRPSLQYPLLYERVNVRGTMVLLEAARRAGVRKFLLASSSSIYGIANQVPFLESDHENLPVSPYAATKIAAEKLCFTYSHLYGLRVVCLRLFTVYGPRQRPDLAIHKFTRMMSRGEAIPMFGDGSSGRDYTYVADTVRGIEAALNYDTAYDVFNLGNSSPVTLREMIGTIEAALGTKANIQQLPDQPGDVAITFADISKARRLLGYSPGTSFAEGVGRFVEWAKERAG